MSLFNFCFAMDLHNACIKTIFRHGACKVQILCVQGRPSSSGDGLVDNNSVSADGIVPCPDFTVVWKWLGCNLLDLWSLSNKPL